MSLLHNSYSEITSQDDSQDVEIIHATDSEIEYPTDDKTRHRKFWRGKVFLIIFALLVTTAVLVLLYLLNSSSEAVTNCGLSPEKAREKGCKFDVMSFSWLPPACYDADLTQQFLADKEWGWYTDPRATGSVPLSEVQEGNLKYVFVSWEFHLVHCGYMWRKMHRAVMSGGPIDGYIMDTNHTAHCVKELLAGKTELNRTTTMIFAKYPECGFHEEEDPRGWYRVEGGKKAFSQPSLKEFMDV
jgi:hypothetical protein